MSDLIGQLAQLITALVVLATFMQSVRNGRQGRRNAAKIEEVHKATNSMKDELVRTTGESEFAKGLKQGEDNPL